MSVHWGEKSQPTKDFGGAYMGDSLPPKKETKAMRRRKTRLERRIKGFESIKDPRGYHRPGSNKPR